MQFGLRQLVPIPFFFLAQSWALLGKNEEKYYFYRLYLSNSGAITDRVLSKSWLLNYVNYGKNLLLITKQKSRAKESYALTGW